MKPADAERLLDAASGGDAVPAALRARAREVAGRLPAPTVVGPYEVIATLGSGGQATVYRARHREGGREVALKIPHADVAERLMREAQILGRLSHPRIVRVEDAGFDGPLPYLATELCRGGSLADVLSPRGDAVLSHERAWAIADAVLDALEYAHGQGVVHRDVKPANILFTESGDVKVADFGIGKLGLAAGPEAPLAHSLTTTGPAGTPAYMAPEQEDPSLAENGKVDGRADLYALGKVLYEALTGRSPRTLRPVSRARTDGLAGWDDFIFKLVEERPQDRYPSATYARNILRTTIPQKPGEQTVYDTHAPNRWYAAGFADGRAAASGGHVGGQREVDPTRIERLGWPRPAPVKEWAAVGALVMLGATALVLGETSNPEPLALFVVGDLLLAAAAIGALLLIVRAWRRRAPRTPGRAAAHADRPGTIAHREIDPTRIGRLGRPRPASVKAWAAVAALVVLGASALVVGETRLFATGGTLLATGLIGALLLIAVAWRRRLGRAAPPPPAPPDPDPDAGVPVAPLPAPPLLRRGEEPPCG